MDMNQIPNESLVYETLKANIVEPGRYTCNPEPTPDGRFPQGEPVFGVLYSGVGHESAGGLMLFDFFSLLLAPIIGAWMLSQTSQRVMSSYMRKVLFFTAIGLLFALFSDLMNYGIGNYPLNNAIILAVHSIVVWTVVGLVVAWRMKPDKLT
jgi:hypothetical protein